MQQVTRKQLGAGVGLTCITTPKFKRAVLQAVLVLPLGGVDTALRAVLPQVLRRGTRKLQDLRAIGAHLDALYGARIEPSVHKEGESVAVGFIADCIDERYAADANGLTAAVIALLSEMLYDPDLQDGCFRADYTESERGNLIDQIAARKNDPRTYAPQRLVEIMCAQEAYGASALGTTAQAEQITPQALYAAYTRALREARIELFYCGTMEPDAVAALFAAELPARADTGIYTPQTLVLAAPDHAPQEHIEEQPVKQGKLSIGLRTGGACLTAGDLLAYRVFSTVLGGSTSAKLFVHVREEQSLCYYASTQLVASKGLLLINSGIENRDFATARDAILQQLALCQAGDISIDEWNAARGALATSWRAMLDDPISLGSYWLSQAVAGTLVPPEERMAALETVTRERVVTAAVQTALDTVYFMKGVAQ